MMAVQVHENFLACRHALGPAVRWFAVETGGARRYDEVDWKPGDAMLFGSERRGLPQDIIDSLRRESGDAAIVSIPMREGNRSLNLSNAVTLVTYEAWRQNGFGNPDATR
jgi:tRNA (cytidine/uridine-2'-O-)-methyltransferase